MDIIMERFNFEMQTLYGLKSYPLCYLYFTVSHTE